MSDVVWNVKFGAPNRITAAPEAGVELIVELRPRISTAPRWAGRLVVWGEMAWNGFGYKLSSEAKNITEGRYRGWRKRQL